MHFVSGYLEFIIQHCTCPGSRSLFCSYVSFTNALSSLSALTFTICLPLILAYLPVAWSAPRWHSRWAAGLLYHVEAWATAAPGSSWTAPVAWSARRRRLTPGPAGEAVVATGDLKGRINLFKQGKIDVVRRRRDHSGTEAAIGNWR